MSLCFLYGLITILIFRKISNRKFKITTILFLLQYKNPNFFGSLVNTENNYDHGRNRYSEPACKQNECVDDSKGLFFLMEQWWVKRKFPHIGFWIIAIFSHCIMYFFN